MATARYPAGFILCHVAGVILWVYEEAKNKKISEKYLYRKGNVNGNLIWSLLRARQFIYFCCHYVFLRILIGVPR